VNPQCLHTSSVFVSQTLHTPESLELIMPRQVSSVSWRCRKTPISLLLSFEIELKGTRFINIFMTTWVLLVVGLLFALPMIFCGDFTKSKDEPYIFDPFLIKIESNLSICVVLSTHQICGKNELNSTNNVSFHTLFGNIVWGCTRPRIVLCNSQF